MLDQKIKEEIEFSILRISEKRYEAEAKCEILTEALSERNKVIEEMKKQIERLTAENTQLKGKVEMYEAGGSKKGQTMGSPTAAKQLETTNRTVRA